MKPNDPDLLYRGTLKAERIWGDGTHPLFQSISCYLQGGGIFSLGAEKNRFKFSFVPTTITFFKYAICVFFALCVMCVIYAADYKSNVPSEIIKLVLILKAISTLSTACHACCTNRPPEDLKHIILMQMLLISA